MKKNIKLGLATIACAIMIAGNPSIAVASEVNQENIIVDDAETVDEVDTTVGVHDGKVMLNEKNFPDENFREHLYELADETGYITISEVNTITISDEKVRDLTGLEYFTDVTHLIVNYCEIDELDVSGFEKLSSLSICGTDISLLDLTKNINLATLGINDCKLNEIKFGNNSLISTLIILETQISGLDFSELTNLQYLRFESNKQSELDLSHNINLTEVRCENSNIENLIFGASEKLHFIDCSDNKLKSLDVSKLSGLEMLLCNDNEITSINFSNHLKLHQLKCQNNKLTNIDVNDFVKLNMIYCYGNNLKTLDFSNNQALKRVWYDYNDVEKVVFNNQKNMAVIAVCDTTDGTFDLKHIEGYDFSLINDSNYNASTGVVSFDENDITKADELVTQIPGDLQYVVKGTEHTEGFNGYGLILLFNQFEGNEEYSAVDVTYHTHIQSYGDSQGTKKNGEMAGTSGEAKRLENIWIDIEGNDNLGVQYSTHCQSYGWMPWSCDGEINGTSGEAKRLEAIKIQLTGADKDNYDIYYRVHAQSYGWLGWAKNGEPSGTAGYAKRLEGIQVVVVKKGEAAPALNYAGVDGSSSKYKEQPYVAAKQENIVIPGDVNAPIVSYKTHVQSFGWQKWVHNGAMSGTSGQAKRLEGINIKVTNCPYDGDIVYTTHVQTYGWKDGKPEDTTRASWKKNGEMSGTSGEAKRLEAICIDLTGEMGEKYDIYYRVHAQSFGWLGWAKNGEESGTAGYAKRLEGIQIVLVPKGGAAPANDFGGVTSVRTEGYIAK